MALLGTSLQTVIRENHPCFSEQAHDEVGRVHLPVAPRCNIQCNYCERRICANMTMQHPGWAKKLLSSEKAAELVESLTHSKPGERFVVGVAGPGEPLANPETFAALGQIHREHPSLLKCVSTNGLLLEQMMPQLIDVGVSAITVTVNAPDSSIGQHIYAWVRYKGVIIRGQEAAEILIDHQMSSIRAAIAAGMVVKVNSVLIPGINDGHQVRLAIRLRDAGVQIMNIIPLIPCGQMKDHRAPTCRELIQARLDCSLYVAQFRRCEQCRADVVHFPRRKSRSAV